MKLISMTDFVLKQNKILNKYINYDKGCLFEIIIYYANFLKQALELWMFVPCDEDGNVLEEPVHYETWLKLHESEGSTIGFDEHLKYQQAKERCLFAGFRIENYTLTNDEIGIGQALTLYSDIESLVCDFYGDIKLTKTAEKLIGL